MPWNTTWSKENLVRYHHFSNLIDLANSLTPHPMLISRLMWDLTKAVCLISTVTTLCWQLALLARRRSYWTVVVKPHWMELQTTKSQFRVIQAKATSALSISIAWTITKTKERARPRRADFTWTIRCFRLTVSKAQSVLMKSKDVSEASTRFNYQKFSQANTGPRHSLMAGYKPSS